MPTRFMQPAATTLDVNGAGSVELTAHGDWAVEHTRVSVGPVAGQERPVKVPRALLYLNGAEFEGTASGANDQSDTRHLMSSGDRLECRWSGGDPGARATLYVRGIQYPAGQGQ